MCETNVRTDFEKLINKTSIHETINDASIH